MISWLDQGWLPEKTETRGKAIEVLLMHSMFNPEVFKMKDGVLIFTKAANRNWIGEVWRIYLPESMVKEVWSLCHQSNLGGHRGLKVMLNKFLKGFFLLSERQKLQFLNGGCDNCLTKEGSLPVRTEEHVPSLTGYVGKKLYIDLVSMSDTVRGNPGMTEDSFSRYCHAYPIPYKEASTVANVMMDKHFNIYGLPDQLHSDNSKEFLNNLWRELFSELKIQRTTTSPYNPSSNPVERLHRTIIAMLRTRRAGVQDN